MTDAFTFSVRGTPRPKARPRFVGGRVVTTATAKEKLWRGAVERAAREAVAYRGDPAPLFLGAVRVTMLFTFEDRARAGQPHTHKPDADNLSKLVLDAMERAGVYRNDSQAAQNPVSKAWGASAGLSVLVESIELEAEQVTSPASGGESPPDWLLPSNF